MATFILNGSIAVTNTAEDILAEGHALTAVVLTIEGADARYNVGADASETAGELVAGTGGVGSATITNLVQQRISIYGASGVKWSIRTAG